MNCLQTIISNTQAIYVDSTVEGIPAGGTEDDKFGPKSGAQVSKAATRWASVSWTIAGVTDDQGNTTQDPPRNTTQTNLTSGTTNVTNYNITTKATGCGNSLFFVMLGEGPTPSSGNKVSNSYAQHFDNELTSFKVTDEKGNVVCADLATAYARGWVEKDSDGKYRMKYDATSKQYYIPINTASGSQWITGTYTINVGLKATVKLDSDNKATTTRRQQATEI